jgi:hypothetical protein
MEVDAPCSRVAEELSTQFFPRTRRSLLKEHEKSACPEAEIALDRRGVTRSVAVITSREMRPVSKAQPPRRTAFTSRPRVVLLT